MAATYNKSISKETGMEILGAMSGYSSNNIEETESFYRDILGLDTTSFMGGFELNISGQRVFVYPKDDHTPATYTVLNLAVNDINVAVDHLVGKGVEFEKYDDLPAAQDERRVLRGKQAGMGPNIAWFKDPAGNILSLIEE